MATRRNVPERVATAEEWAYLAGIVDGEGAVTIGFYQPVRPTFNPRYAGAIQVANTSEALIAWLLKTFGGDKSTRKKYDGRQQTWLWNVSAKHAAEIATGLLPYAIVKRQQLEILLKLFEYRTPGTRLPPEEVERRRQLWLQMKALNIRGDRQRLSETTPSNGEAIVWPASKDAEVSRND